MRPPDDLEVGAWLTKARSDLHMAAFALSESGRLWDQACFHSQQAAEKGIKAVLVSWEMKVPRTHDLVSLLEQCSRAAPLTQELLEKAAVLSQYGVAARYPSFLAPETRQDARQAYAFAVSLCRWSCQAIGAKDFSRPRLVLTGARRTGRVRKPGRSKKR